MCVVSMCTYMAAPVSAAVSAPESQLPPPAQHRNLHLPPFHARAYHDKTDAKCCLFRARTVEWLVRHTVSKANIRKSPAAKAGMGKFKGAKGPHKHHGHGTKHNRQQKGHARVKVAAENAQKQQESAPASGHSAAGFDLGLSFESDYNDHFETPVDAYRDILPALQCLSTSLHVPLRDLSLFDPYYCQGSMVERLRQLGLNNVINRNRDFYKDVRTKQLPAYDVLVTNPPYSADHKQRLLDFLATADKPYALLLPAYIATKAYWSAFSSGRQVIYLCPPAKYQYDHPEGTGKEDSPFYSAWFLGGWPDMAQLRVALLREQQRRKREGEQICKILSTVDEMIERGVVKYKRPNPKRRNKNKGSAAK